MFEEIRTRAVALVVREMRVDPERVSVRIARPSVLLIRDGIARPSDNRPWVLVALRRATLFELDELEEVLDIWWAGAASDFGGLRLRIDVHESLCAD